MAGYHGRLHAAGDADARFAGPVVQCQMHMTRPALFRPPYGRGVTYHPTEDLFVKFHSRNEDRNPLRAVPVADHSPPNLNNLQEPNLIVDVLVLSKPFSGWPLGQERAPEKGDSKILVEHWFIGSWGKENGTPASERQIYMSVADAHVIEAAKMPIAIDRIYIMLLDENPLVSLSDMAMSSLWNHSLLLLVLFLFPFHAVGAAKCFYPEGQDAAGDAPCNPELDTSPCCGGGYGMVCLENGLCLGPKTNIVRGSCTDANWGPGCSRLCLANNSINKGGSMGGPDLISCANSTGNEGSYCCDHLSNCCDTGVGRFQIQRPRPTASWNTQASRFELVAQSSTSSSAATSAANPTTSSDSPGTQGDPAPTTAGATPQSTERPAEEQQGLASSTAAGIGTGVGIGVSALAVFGYMALKRYRSNKAISNTQAAPTGGDPIEVDGSAQHKYDTGNWGFSTSAQELHGQQRPQELHDQYRHELPEQYRPQELPGDSYRG
ncbi:hypothetical protein PG997_012970 [Apiospora hydei]|uniref:Uncharacterized protein n=1 Tax=Apiospora hydei TaxID=1337664 RepID=A0ABR1V4V0_9PEZI